MSSYFLLCMHFHMPDDAFHISNILIQLLLMTKEQKTAYLAVVVYISTQLQRANINILKALQPSDKQ